MNCTLEKDGFIGTFYPGTRYKEKGIILVGGSGEKRQLVEKKAEILSKSGFSVLALGYYLWKPLSKNTVNIPLDYVENAIDWLKNKCEVKIEKIGMTGISLGAQYTLLCASYFKEISCIVPISGFDFVVEGCKNMIIRQHKSYYSYHNQDVPYEKAESLSHIFSTLRKLRKNKEYTMKSMNRFYYNECFKQRSDLSRIKVENICANILLMSPKYDDTWPSDEAYIRIINKLKEVKYQYKYQYKIYEKGSHLLAVPKEAIELIGGEKKLQKILSKFFTIEKKYPEECAKARLDSWNELIDFFKEW